MHTTNFLYITFNSKQNIVLNKKSMLLKLLLLCLVSISKITLSNVIVYFIFVYVYRHCSSEQNYLNITLNLLFNQSLVSLFLKARQSQ